MVEVPSKTGVINPVEAFIVATPVDPDCQVPPALPLVVNVTVLLEQSACVPLSVPALAAAVTVTVRVAVAFVQGADPVTVYVIVAVPAAMPDMAPVDAFTVATAASLVVHAPPAVPLLVKVVLPPTQIACVPLTVPALGAATTVTVVDPDAEKPVASVTVRL
jgi:hypothetical protein